MVQEDLCNSHMSIAGCTVERSELILGRENGSRAQCGMEGHGSLKQRTNRDLGLQNKAKLRLASAPRAHLCSHAASPHLYMCQQKPWSLPLVHQRPSLTFPARCLQGKHWAEGARGGRWPL